MNLQDGVSLYEGLIITLFSMGVVFLTLIVISLILEAFKYIFSEEDSKKIVKDEKTPIVGKETIHRNDKIIEEEIVAVIGAAIAAHRADKYRKINDEDLAAVLAAAIAASDGGNMENLSIKSIKRI